MFYILQNMPLNLKSNNYIIKLRLMQELYNNIFRHFDKLYHFMLMKVFEAYQRHYNE